MIQMRCSKSTFHTRDDGCTHRNTNDDIKPKPTGEGGRAHQPWSKRTGEWTWCPEYKYTFKNYTFCV